MGQVETKVFEHQAPPWDVRDVLKSTNLSEEEVSICWAHWRTLDLSKSGKIHYKTFLQLLSVDENDEEVCR